MSGKRNGTERRRGTAALMAVALLGALGCASGGGGAGEASASSGPYGAASAEAAVTGFLDAVELDDYRAMGRLFGSPQGPALERWGPGEVEQRMFILASLLEHAGYRLRKARLTEGPDRERWLADMVGTRNGDVTVPFITVRHESRWYVERVETEALTRTRG